MTIFANKILRVGALTMIGMHGWLLQWPYYLLNLLLWRWIAMKQQPLPHPREPVAPMKAGWIGPLKVAYTAHGITNGGVKKLWSFNFSIFQFFSHDVCPPGASAEKTAWQPQHHVFRTTCGFNLSCVFFQPRKALYLSHPPHCQAKRCPGASIGAISKQ